ncbi:UNVERIFIED_CONTAM: hypothetical protein PYX00_004826 [Menopon gallinae]|uniref:Pre-mRNA 3' end processing protein WDR33 n=1 Tax=Menopon gallinae TaxID=328185 RepID=A0AAW2I666_9NEOP
MMESENTTAAVGSFGDSDDRFGDIFTPPDFSRPPPNMDQNYSTPPPNRLPPPPPNQNMKFRQVFRPQHNNNMLNNLPDDFDGKRLRKTTMRKTVDYNASIIKALQNRVWQRDHRDRHALQPDVLYLPEVLPPPAYKDNAINAVTTRFVKTATNKMRCPIFCMAWTPEGRRLVTGASSGEFTLWNGLTFNFETILQAHDSPVRSMVWSNNDAWMITGDHSGYSKYWQSNMNNVKMFQAHKEAIRGLSFSPTDQKLVSCSDDGTLRIWDFARCHEEKVLRGHGSDVKCCDWHPQLGLIASGSKDNQQPIKLWEPKTGQCLTTLHAHKSTVMDLKWNKNGNWFVTASRDHFLKLFDVRNLSQVVQTFRGHKKEASCLAWHPHHEGLIASGGSDGAILFWHVGADKEVGAIDAAHESIVWTLDWHPLGHILCSGSNDHTSKFWTRNRPGDLMRDKYNLNTLPPSLPGMEDNEIEDTDTIPGMAPEDRVEVPAVGDSLSLFKDESSDAIIPGLEDDFMDPEMKKKKTTKKQPYAKPIPKNFVAQWNETGLTAEEEEEASEGYGSESVLDPINQIINKFIEQQPGVKKLEELEPTAVVVFGKVLPVRPGQRLYKKIFKGREALNKYILSGKIKELQDVLPIDSEVCPTESDSDSSSMEVDPPNDEDDNRSLSNYVTSSAEDVDLRRFNKDSKESDEDFRMFGSRSGQGQTSFDQDMRFMQDHEFQQNTPVLIS